MNRSIETCPLFGYGGRSTDEETGGEFDLVCECFDNGVEFWLRRRVGGIVWLRIRLVTRFCS